MKKELFKKIFEQNVNKNNYYKNKDNYRNKQKDQE